MSGGCHHPRVRGFLISLAAVAAVVASVAGWIYMTTNFDATSGSGWRLLAAAPRQSPEVMSSMETSWAGLITQPEDLPFLWSALGVEAASEPDFDREVVLWVVGIGSGSCPLHFDGLQFSGDRIVAQATKGFWMACSADAVPYTFVLAVERHALPERPFTLRVASEWERDVVIPSSDG